MNPVPSLLLLGSTGRLGRHLLRCSSQQSLVSAPGRAELDLSTASEDELARYLDRIRPDCVLNAAAMALVDACEVAREEALAVNAIGPGHLAEACERAGVPLVHVSTDYVFGARPGPFGTDAPRGPVQWYGETKRRGEEAVLGACRRAAVPRVSWLFDSEDSAFPRFVLGQVAEGRNMVAVHAGQRSRPTFMPTLAQWLVELTACLVGGGEAPRILHPAGGPFASRGEWARVLLDAHGHTAVAVVDQPIEATEGDCARRPADSRLEAGPTREWSRGVGLPEIGDWRLHTRALASR